MTPRPRLEVLEVEAEDVVALDHVGVALGDDAACVSASSAASSRRSPRTTWRKPGRVGERDGDDAIGRTRGAGELVALAGDDLDVERQPAQLAEAHAPERGASAREQVLLHRVGDEAGTARRACRRDARLRSRLRSRAPSASAHDRRSGPASAARRGPAARRSPSTPGGVGDERGSASSTNGAKGSTAATVVSPRRCQTRMPRPSSVRPKARSRGVGSAPKSRGAWSLSRLTSCAMGGFYTRGPVYARAHAPACLGGARRLGRPRGLRRVRRVIPERDAGRAARHLRERGAPGGRRARFPPSCSCTAATACRDSTRQWAEWFRARGYVALIVD